MHGAQPPTGLAFALPVRVPAPGSVLPHSAAGHAATTAAGRVLCRTRVEDGPLDTPCWIWQGARQSCGYGLIRVGGGSPVLVHRLMRSVLVGPIPAGLELDHLCRRPACVNPAHCEPVTHHVNQSRGLRARRETCGRGHPLTPENTRRHGRHQRRKCRRCDRDLARVRRGLSPEQIDDLERAYQTQRAA